MIAEVNVGEELIIIWGLHFAVFLKWQSRKTLKAWLIIILPA